MQLTVKQKVVLGAAGVLLVGMLSMVVIYGALRTAQRAMHEVAEVEEPTSAAAYEMEINVIGAGLGVLKYLDTGDPQYRDRVEKDEADFERFKARYDETAWYLCHRIREAMGNDPLEGPTLLGIVEVDVGGNLSGKGAGE